VRIGFVFAPGRKERLAGTRRGESASEFYYAAIELERRGHTIGQFEPGDYQRAGAARLLLDKLFAAQLLPARTGGQVLQSLAVLCGQLNSYDVVVGTSSPYAYGLATLGFARMLTVPVVGIHCGLVNYPHSRIRRLINGMALRRSHTQLFGDGEYEATRTLFRVPEQRIEVNQFGVDTVFWNPGEDERDYVLAVGNDSRRDFRTLVNSASLCGEIPFKVVTKREPPTPLPGNVEWVQGGWHEQALTDRKLRSLYRGARAVVVPLIDSPQPSGQSVCLQAMACGRPAILTRTSGLWSETMMRDQDNVLMVSPGDPKELAATIKRLYVENTLRRRLGERGRATVLEQGNIEQFAFRLESLCQRVLDNR